MPQSEQVVALAPVSALPDVRPWAATGVATPPPLTLVNPPILVVDDDQGIRELLSDVLSMEGYDVCTATNGAEALAIVARTAPRLVLLDMRMPVLDGWGFAHALHENGAALLPLVVMSGAVNADRWASEIDAAGYIRKPFDLGHLLATVERVLQPGKLPTTPSGRPWRSEAPLRPAADGWCSDWQ